MIKKALNTIIPGKDESKNWTEELKDLFVYTYL